MTGLHSGEEFAITKINALQCSLFGLIGVEAVEFVGYQGKPSRLPIASISFLRQITGKFDILQFRKKLAAIYAALTPQEIRDSLEL